MALMGLTASESEIQAIIRGVDKGLGCVSRDVLWDWTLSRVERVHLNNGTSVIVKRSRTPLTDEGRILRHISRSDIPLPDLYYSRRRGDILTLVLEDLGPPTREATLQEAAMVAAHAHAAPPPKRLPLLDAAALEGLPSRTLASVDQLTAAGRWSESAEVRSALVRLRDIGRRMIDGAEVPPFGLCHSEFHPSSVHIGSEKLGLLDWSQAFVGPGLLDLASYSGTVLPPDSTACLALIEAYVVQGGAPEARSPWAGLPAENWALFWHRCWTVEWFVRSCATWMTDTAKDAVYQETVQRHLDEALQLVDGS